MAKTKEMSSGAMIALGQKMVRNGDNFEASLGSALLYASFKNQRKIITNFENIVDKFRPIR